ncbi:GntR family transcriptional regulator [Amycolatopsis sp. FBCC-B4732]|uniref:GntR family transcriptional regulator n=1 Tax=Amycolatopsis sp. FBCC-B4732 TaxID=3079339 RepID=UPI001FF68F91|nr:GntR family transcriptional regulator [Amycolatopsis sp. FBCC-B4732]UOX87591.1 GntR family transcriptional regulator [Amycolatopsis sp. FBCC-B4732]
MYSKRQQLVGDLTDLIRSGRLANGERLPGEHQLALQYQVSRGTVRSALSELQQLDLISTQAGVGSFVTFDGVQLDQRIGWARALADAGAPVTTELLGIETVRDQALHEEFGPETYVAVRRLRREHDRGVSLETATVPAVGPLAELPETGLRDDSLTKTLEAAGLVSVGGDQWISTERLDACAAELLGRSIGELFLRAERTSVDVEGGLVERVVSLLDPDRFQFHLTFGHR